MIIKNKDMPAMPTQYADLAENGNKELYCDNQGLTKRETAILMFMQGILSNPDVTLTAEESAKVATSYADAAFEVMEKNK